MTRKEVKMYYQELLEDTTSVTIDLKITYSKMKYESGVGIISTPFLITEAL